MKVLKLASLIVCSAMIFAGCSSSGKDKDNKEAQKMTVTSSSIGSDGKIAEKCVDTTVSKEGKNVSPQVSWNKIDGAKCYAIIMYDISASWSHMIVTDINADVTSIDEGKYNDFDLYVGPYPPKGSGPHKYQITVFALKKKPTGKMPYNNANVSFDKIKTALDKAGSSDGNIITSGSVTGTFENK